MIDNKLKFRLYSSIFFFILTLLPFGYYYTASWKSAFFNSIIMFFLCFVSFKFLVDYHSAIISKKLVTHLSNKIFFYLFACDELKMRTAVFAVPVIASFFTGYFVFDNLPITGDSIAQYDHAKLLVQGMFSATANPFPEFFPLFHVIDSGERWYSQYQLGHLLILAVGHFLGVVYLINPIMCGLSALLLYSIAYDNYGKRTARITGLLTIFCAQWIYMASEYMNHNTTLLGCLLFVWSWFRLLKLFEVKYSFFSGLGLGLALITRPITTIAIVFPFCIYGLYKLLREPLKRWFVFVPAILVTSLLIAWQLYFNLQTTGDFLVFGPEKLYGEQVRYGFGRVVTTIVFGEFYTHSVHDFWRGIGHLSNNLIGINSCLFGWPVPALFFVFCGWFVFRRDIASQLMFLSFAMLGLAYIPYFYQDFIFGARYLYEGTGFLIIATALGIERIPAILRVYGVKIVRSKIIVVLNFYICLLIVIGVGLFVLFRYNEKAGYHYDRSALEIDLQFPDNSLVFANKHYNQFMVFMPPLDINRVIYAKDLGDENEKLINYYPTRKVFLETESGFMQLESGK